MSDIQEEMKRIYKKVIEKDLERNYEQNLFVGRAIKLEEENKELQDRINKAIKYIEYEMPCLWEVDEIFEDMDGKDYNTWKEYDENKLLNILKGDILKYQKTQKEYKTFLERNIK